MADTKMNDRGNLKQDKPNETMQREQGQSGQAEKGREREEGGLEKGREKGAIGGKTESGIDKQSPTASEFEKSRGEPAGQR